MTQTTETHKPVSQAATKVDIPPYRLIHSSGELVFGQLAEACAAMRQLPGAKVFVAPGS